MAQLAAILDLKGGHFRRVFFPREVSRFFKIGFTVSMDSSTVNISRGAVESLKPSGEIFSLLAKNCILGV